MSNLNIVEEEKEKEEKEKNHLVTKMAHGDMSADMPPHFIGK